MLKPKADDYILIRCKTQQGFEHYTTMNIGIFTNNRR
jgi:hypothetical protein